MTANKLKPNNARFVIFQLLGWSGWVVLLIVRDLTFVPAEYMVSRSGIFILDALVGMTLTTCLRYLYRYVWEMAAYIRVATVLGGSYVVSVTWQPIKDVITRTDIGSSVDLTDYGWVSFLRSRTFSFSLVLVLSVLYLSIKYYQVFLVEAAESLRSEVHAHEALWRMLRSQLKPLIQYTTLNAISTVVLQKDSE